MRIVFISSSSVSMCIEHIGFMLQTHSNRSKYVSIADNLNVVKCCTPWKKSHVSPLKPNTELME